MPGLNNYYPTNCDSKAHGLTYVRPQCWVSMGGDAGLHFYKTIALILWKLRTYLRMYFCSHAHTMEELIDRLLLHTLALGRNPFQADLGTF